MTSVYTPSSSSILASSTCVIDVETAYQKILDNSPHLPFFVGAGISYPEVPLAFEIVQKLAHERIYNRHISKGIWKKRFPDDKEADFEFWKNDNKWLESKDSYSRAMLEAFGDDPDDVAVINQYFQDHILSNAIPNFSHYALALLMKYNFINKTCITTNFDRLIEMAFMRIEGCDAIPIRTATEIDIWDHERHYIIKVHGDGHFYNMKQTQKQTTDWDEKFKKLILGFRQHFSGLVIIGLGGHENSIKDFFKAYMESYKTQYANPSQHRGVLWGIRTKRPLIFHRDKPSKERDEFISCIESEANSDIIEIFKDASSKRIPFYFFPIANARHFFFHLVQRFGDNNSASSTKKALTERFSSEILRFYGGDEWVYSSIRKAKDRLRLTEDEADKYREKLDKANERIKSQRNKPLRSVTQFSALNYLNSKVTLIVGDISICESDVIVSSDDILLMMNDGVAGAIRTAGGGQIIQDVQKFEGKLPLEPPEVIVTNAGKLKVKYVFHAAILDPRSPNQKFDQLIRKSVEKCLVLMKTMSCKSITFPLLASGTAGTSSFGPKESAECIFDTIKNFLVSQPSVELEITVCVYGESTIRDNDLESLLNRCFV